MIEARGFRLSVVDTTSVQSLRNKHLRLLCTVYVRMPFITCYVRKCYEYDNISILKVSSENI